ncbi:MAG: hypothetical protein IPI07_18215 [Flavobacteriales bacterium]|nr:hypothetical protein [Flavobacteriales bacterium]
MFSYMTMALVISGVMAWWFGNDTTCCSTLIDFETGKQYHPGLGGDVRPLGLVLVMGGMVNRMSATVLMAVFLVFSCAHGHQPLVHLPGL